MTDKLVNSVKFLVVEDEVLIAEDLKDRLNMLGINDVQLAHSKEETFFKLNHFEIDVVLLDIHLEHSNDGLEIAKRINDSFKIPFLFITSHTDIVTIQKIIELKPFAYLSKPIKNADLTVQVELVKKQVLSERKDFIMIKDGVNWFKVFLNDICCIVADGNYLNIFCGNKKYNTRIQLSSILDELPQPPFIKLNRSTVLNMDKITSFTRKSVFVEDLEFVISRNNSKEIAQVLETYLSR
jgi:DNA-binding LytR/AlgR family response regulator